MQKLIEITVRGNRYNLLEELSYDQMENLKEFARTFYATNNMQSFISDDDIAKEFIAKANIQLGLQLKLINIDLVLVIK